MYRERDTYIYIYIMLSQAGPTRRLRRRSRRWISVKGFHKGFP